MTTEQIQRFDMFKSGPIVPLDFAQDYYGLAWPLTGVAASSFDHYVRTQRRRDPRPDEEHLSRNELEGFMEQNDVLTKKWVGASLGMRVGSLETLLSKLDSFGMITSRYLVGDQFVAESLSEDLTRHMPGLRFRTFSDHTAFCRRFHTELKKEIDLDVEPLFCATSDRLRERRRLVCGLFRLPDLGTS